jgi:hypothetical protein
VLGRGEVLGDNSDALSVYILSHVSMYSAGGPWLVQVDIQYRLVPGRPSPDAVVMAIRSLYSCGNLAIDSSIRVPPCSPRLDVFTRGKYVRGRWSSDQKSTAREMLLYIFTFAASKADTLINKYKDALSNHQCP